jgi:hypothetical protein
MTVTVTQNSQGLLCTGASVMPVQVRHDAASAVRGIITAAVFELDSIETLVLRGVNLEPLFPPNAYQASPMTPLSQAPPGAILGNARGNQHSGPMVNRNSEGEMRQLPPAAHPYSRVWASLNPYLSPSPSTRIVIDQCFGFGGDSQRWRLVRWIQYVLPRVPHGQVQTSNVLRTAASTQSRGR